MSDVGNTSFGFETQLVTANQTIQDLTLAVSLQALSISEPETAQEEVTTQGEQPIIQESQSEAENPATLTPSSPIESQEESPQVRKYRLV